MGLTRNYNKLSKDNNLEGIIFQSDELIIFFEYETGFEPSREYCTFSQSSKVIVPLELFEGQMAVERLN